MKMRLTILLTVAILLVANRALAQIIKGTYAIKNVETGMLLRVKDANKKDGTPIVAYQPTNWKCMTWDFVHVDGQTYQLKNLFTGKTFQTVDDNVLQQKPLVPNLAGQEYEFIPAGDKVFLIRSKATGLYVTAADKEGTINSAIIMAPKQQSKLQQWTIYLQDPVM